MKYLDWESASRIEQEYQQSLKEIMDRFTHLLMGFGLTNPYDLIHLLQSFAETEYFKEYTRAAASRMATGLFVDGARSWREAAQQSMNGRAITAALRTELQGPVGMEMERLIRNNAQLISTFTQSMAEQVNRFIAREAVKGRRSESISSDLVEQFPGVAQSRLRLIARTETSKTSTALTEARARYLRLDWYVWRTSKDGRVRASHRLMDRVIVSWGDPPSPEKLAGEKKTYGEYAPGNIFNCRCYPQPLIDIDDVRWPCRTYTNGRILMMTRAQFKSIAGGGLRYAA